MIHPFFDTVRRRCAPVLVTLLVSLSVLVPLLDRAEASAGPVLESEHNPSTCVRVHDHTVCTQYSSNLSSPSSAPRHGGPPHAPSATARVAEGVIVALAEPAPHQPRAPPLR